MRALSILSILVLTIVISRGVSGQEAPSWPPKSTSLGIYASTVLIASPVNIELDHFVHKEKIHFGFTTGLTTLFFWGFEEARMGGHFTFSFFTGSKEHHFENKLGFAYMPLYLYSIYDSGFDFKVIPVITLGYRHQKPGDKSYFRIGVSTGGVGIGFGTVLGKKPSSQVNE